MPVLLLFFANIGRTGDTKKTAPTDLSAARDEPIWFSRGQVNRVRRIGAFTWGQTKKLPWVEVIAAELTKCLPAKTETRKESRSLARRFADTGHSTVTNGYCGGDTRPSGRLADCQPGYTSLSATARRNLTGSNLPTTGRRPRKGFLTVGATTDPRHGCSVNTVESASRLIRLHRSPEGWSGLNGWGCYA